MGEIILSRMKGQLKKQVGSSKVCNKCPENGLQPLSNFHKRKLSTDGHSNICKSCCNLEEKKKRDERKMFDVF